MVRITTSYRYIALVFLYIFGFYGWGVGVEFRTNEIFKEVVIIFLVVSSILILYRKRNILEREIYFSIKKKEFLTTTMLFVILLFLNYWRFNDALTLDEIAYAWSSQLHSYVLLFKIAELNIGYLISVPSNILIQIIAALLLVLMILSVIILIRIRNEKKFLFTVFLLLFFLRLMVSHFGGGASQHAPLGYLYYFIFTSLLGTSTLVFRIATLVLFVISIHLMQLFLKNHIRNYPIFFTTILTIYSVPLIGNMLSMMEVSVWTYLVNSLVFVFLFSRKFQIPSSLVFFVSILTYLRMSILATLASLFIAYFVQNRRNIQLYSRLGLPFVVALPAVVINVFERLASSDLESKALLYNLRENISNNVYAINTSASTIAFILACVMLVFHIIFRASSRIFIVTYFLSNSILFLLFTSPSISFNSKYLVEWYLPPLFLYTAWLCTRRLRSFQVLGVITVAFGLFIYLQNYLTPKVVERFNEQYNMQKKSSIWAYGAIPRIPLAYEAAFEFLRNKKDYCLSVGPVYSVFPEVLYGFEVKYLADLKELRARFLSSQSRYGESWLAVSNDSLEDAGVKCALIGFIENEKETIDDLLLNEWTIVKTFGYGKFNTTLYLMRR